MWHVLILFVRGGPKAGRKHVADFYMFYLGEGIASVKHVVLTADQSVNRSTERRSNKMADSSIRMSLLGFFPHLISLRKFQITATAARRNSQSSLSKRESVTTHDHFIYLGLGKIEATAF